MAQEITVTQRLQVTKSSLKDDTTTITLRPTMTGDAISDQSQDVPTDAGGTAVNISADIGTAGWAMFYNLDATNYVEIGAQVAATFYPVLKLKAGESFPCRIATDTLYARANTATVKLRSKVYED